MTEISDKAVEAAAAVLLGRVNAPEQEIYAAARAALRAALPHLGAAGVAVPERFVEDQAGALIAAEIDRLDRAALAPAASQEGR